MIKFLWIPLCIFTFFLSQFSYAQYAGTYTVGGSSPNFVNLDSAFANLSKKGVSGSVRLNVRSGTYNQMFTIKNIKGTSNTNMVHVAPDPKNTSKVILKYKSPGWGYSMINIKQGHLRFDSIQFHVDSSGGMGKIIDITSACENITFNYCTFFGKDSAWYHYGDIISTDSACVNNLKILNCSLYGGFTSINHPEFSYIPGKDFEVRNNRILNFVGAGIYVENVSSVKIQGNYLVGKNSKNSNGIFNYKCTPTEIISNQVFVKGIMCIGIRIAVSDSIKVINNSINLSDSTLSFYTSTGLSLENVKDCEVYYNTIKCTNKNSSSNAVRIMLAQNFIIFKNNNVVHLGAGRAYVADLPNGGMDMDYNNYYAATNNLGWCVTFLRNLSEIQKITGFERHSTNFPVKFTNSSSLRTTSLALNAAAQPIKNITTDIDGNSRDSLTPDIGAYEFTPLANDICLTKIGLSKPASNCGNDSVEIKAIIKNGSKNKITNFKLYLEISGNYNQKLSYDYYDTLKPEEKDTVFFKKINTHKGGIYKFKTYISYSGDADISNDTLTIEEELNNWLVTPAAKNDTICNNISYTLKTKYSPYTSLRWYRSATSTQYLKADSVYKVGNLKKDTVFYMKAVASSLFTDSCVISNLNQNGPAGIMFDVRPRKNMLIDGFSSLINTGANPVVSVYFRKGTHYGNEKDSNRWKFIEKVNVKPVSGTVKIPLKQSISLEKDSLYAIYLMYDARYMNTYNYYLDSDIIIYAGSKLQSPFDNVGLGPSFLGTIYFRKGNLCESERVKYSLKIKDAPVISLGRDTSYCSNEWTNYQISPGPGFASYKWSTSDTSSAILVKTPGIYSVIVVNSDQCSEKDEIVITKNISPKPKIGNDTTYCVGNGFSHTFNAGNGFKNYSWNTSSSNQYLTVKAGGIYSVEVTDDKNCTGSDTTIINEKIVKPNLGKDTISCINPGINISLDAGKGYKDYKWSTSENTRFITIGSSGVYRVQVTDTADCIGFDTVFVIMNLNPKINLGKDTAFCSNIIIDKLLNAGSGYTYNWSTGEKTQVIKASSFGKYYVDVTDNNNCKGSDTIKISSNQAPVVKLGPDRIVKSPVNETLDAGPGYKKYLWNTSETTQTIKVNSEGTYSVNVTDNNGCLGVDTIKINIEVGINDFKTSDLQIFPNPSKDMFNIVSKQNVIDKIEVFEMNGKLIYKDDSLSSNYILTTANWANGIYLLTIKSGNIIYKAKVSVQH